MKWASVYATVAVACNCPLPVVWEMTLGQIRLYLRALNDVLPLHNSFAGFGKEKPITDAREAVTALRGMGVTNVKNQRGVR